MVYFIIIPLAYLIASFYFILHKIIFIIAFTIALFGFFKFYTYKQFKENDFFILKKMRYLYSELFKINIKKFKQILEL